MSEDDDREHRRHYTEALKRMSFFLRAENLNLSPHLWYEPEWITFFNRIRQPMRDFVEARAERIEEEKREARRIRSREEQAAQVELMARLFYMAPMLPRVDGVPAGFIHLGRNYVDLYKDEHNKKRYNVKITRPSYHESPPEGVLHRTSTGNYVLAVYEHTPRPLDPTDKELLPLPLIDGEARRSLRFLSCLRLVKYIINMKPTELQEFVEVVWPNRTPNQTANTSLKRARSGEVKDETKQKKKK